MYGNNFPVDKPGSVAYYRSVEHIDGYRLDLRLHRFHVYIEGEPRFFFTNPKAATDMLRFNDLVREAKWVEIIDSISKTQYYTRGKLAIQ